MQSLRTHAVILRRINYGEADRILTLLTRDYGKVALIAKGVRKEKSKLAGGIELMSESDISFIKGKGDIGTLVSTQLSRHFGNIHTDLGRMNVASEFLRRIDKVSEDETSSEFYDLVLSVFVALNTPEVPPVLVSAWATMRLLVLLGEVMSVESDSNGDLFVDSQKYQFSYEDSQFVPSSTGEVLPIDIKFLRLLGSESPARIMAVKDVVILAEKASKLLNFVYQYSRPNTAKY